MLDAEFGKKNHFIPLVFLLLMIRYWEGFCGKFREIRRKQNVWNFIDKALLSFSRSLQPAPALTADNIYLGLIIYATDKYLLVWNAAPPGRNNY